jgi:hypothetical protein
VHLNCGHDRDGGQQEESKSFWQLIPVRAKADGRIAQFSTKSAPKLYALRHLIQDQCLAATLDPIIPAGKKEIRYVPKLVDYPDDPAAAFLLVPIESTSGQSNVRVNSFFRLQHVATGSFLHTSSR